MRIKNTAAILFCFSLAFVGVGQTSQNINLLSHWSNDTLKPSTAHLNTYNETWGFVQNGIEYGVIGSTWGTHIFDLSTPANITEVASIKGAYNGTGVVHRDYHDYNGYLYIVCDEGQGISKLRIVDLQYLPDSVSTVYLEDTLFSRSHNIFIDTANAKLYTCSGDNNPGVRVFSLINPIVPAEISSVSLATGSHDVYVKNDTAFINDGYSGLFIYDFSTTFNPTLIGSLTTYPQQGYNHSGWLSENGSTYIMGDENHGKDIKIVDVSDLSNISILSTTSSQANNPFSVPHNIMIKNNNAFVSYYFDGLVIYNISDPSNPYISGYYNTSTEPHSNKFRGCWGVYSFLPSGIILASDMQNGLYVLDVTNATGIQKNKSQANVIVFPNPATNFITISTKQYHKSNYQIVDINGKLVKSEKLTAAIETIPINTLTNGTYFVKVRTPNNKTFIKKIVKQ